MGAKLRFREKNMDEESIPTTHLIESIEFWTKLWASVGKGGGGDG